MEQLILQATVAASFAALITLGIVQPERKARKSSSGRPDADGRIWLITEGTRGLIGGEYIEE